MQLVVLWRATRAYSLPASIVPVLLGTVLAAGGYGTAGRGHFGVGVFFLTLCGAVFAHFGANVLNDYFDFVRGVDTRPEHGSGVLTGGQMTAAQALGYSISFFAAAAACALLLLPANPTVVLSLALTGLACAVLYPAFLKRYGLGDVLIVLAFGPALTLGTYGVQTHAPAGSAWLWVCLYSLPICFLVDAILHANNLRDAVDDRAAHVRTLATLLSPKAGQAWQQVLLFAPLLFVITAVAARLLPVWSLAVFAATPVLWRASRSGSVQTIAQAHLAFGLIYALSLLARPAGMV